MPNPAKPIKQVTLDNLPTTPIKQNPKTNPANQKKINITQMETNTKIDELHLKISFKLEPSWRAFSKIKANLIFENTTINTTHINVLQGPLGTNELEYSWIMDTKGLSEGTYQLKIEMYEEWPSNEKLHQTNREITVKYIPQTRQARLIKIPFIKKVTGPNLAVISTQEKQIYTNIQKAIKKEQNSQRDT
ncbi:MAG: hypothetical protein FWD52_01710 [Candidatus Bathyarchaeota archaeon]|nr:hypothetical protein [Candidatus Termiticorpusculum sp.]